MNRTDKGKKVVCAVCGTEFITLNPHAKYCSLICREAATRNKRRIWHMNNPYYSRDYMRRYRKKETKGNEIS